MNMQPLAISRYSIVNCLGKDASAVASALRARRSGLAPCDFETVTLDTWIGEVAGVDDVRVRPDLAAYDCRNNRLAQMGLEADGYAAAVVAAREKVWRRAHRRVHGHQHLRHAANRARVSPARSCHRRPAAGFSLCDRRRIVFRSRISCSATSR
jgi:hypothetical protein